MEYPSLFFCPNTEISLNNMILQLHPGGKLETSTQDFTLEVKGGCVFPTVTVCE